MTMRSFLPALAMLALHLGGCATSPEQQAELAAAFRVEADPALFGAEAAATEALPSSKVALLVSPAVSGATAALPSLPGGWMMWKKESPTSWRLQASSIVEMAMLKAARQATQSELKLVASMPVPGDGYSATLELVAVHFDYDEHVRFLVPIPVPLLYGLVGEFEASMRLSMQLSLFDPHGRQVWTRTYDDGTRAGVWVYPTGDARRNGDPDWLPGVKRAAHEAAWRLSQRALHDLGEWQSAERSRPSSL